MGGDLKRFAADASEGGKLTILQPKGPPSRQISMAIPSSSSAKSRTAPQRHCSRLARKWNIAWSRYHRAVSSFTELCGIRTFVVGVHGKVQLEWLRLVGDTDLFVFYTHEALYLIEKYDPRAWSMVEHELRYIVDNYLIARGSYNPRRRSCQVDFERCFKPPNSTDLEKHVRTWYAARLASTIVHEATHGRIHSMGFGPTKKTREQIERICVFRQRRFLSRLYSDHYDLTEIVAPFDTKCWESLWDRKQRKQRQLERRARFCHDWKLRKCQRK